ncbi:lipopolysaccharide export system permease protein [Chitinophaga costaii]|uniref:Lipopolysaccharide export system permease protein n=1 Tax=Chitinophaga costaii TaxID=1335309 RepID=A0A1C4BYS2_9BACT|nr:LptF/LptG family permease [Chitinophaga costaii]PUZ27422.1 YjgP/YjgQ family permease [Chitinophaga costaii]SCC11883.1 lipopolysaccharide export system permease protein [Chitinophaga costaii]
MKKLDWYIFKKFVGTFFYSLIILLVISVVIDITEKVDDFMRNNLTLKTIIFDYYIGFIPSIAALLFPLFIFISVIFFTSKMAYRSEIIAILASGVSFRRFLRPYWVGAFFFGGVLWLANRWVVPNANRIVTSFQENYVRRHEDVLAIYDKTVRIDSFNYVTFGSWDPNYKSGATFVMQEIHRQNIAYKLKADRITWDSVAHKWKMYNISMRHINGLKETWTYKQDSLMKLRITPEELINKRDEQVAMTTPQLTDYINRQQLRGAEGLNTYLVEKYRRTAAAFMVVILTLIGGVIASRKVRGGSGLHLAIGIVISATYIIFLQFATVFSTKSNLNPLLAVWIPNVIFGALAFYLYRRAPK